MRQVIARVLPCVLLGFATMVSLPPRVRADDASEARLNFDLGAELYGQRRFEEALQRFVASNRLVPNPNVTFNIAQTYALLGRHMEAYNWYETYLRAFELDEGARRRGEAARDALLPRVAVVDIVSQPGGAALFIDREDLGSVGMSPRRVAMAPGEHRVLARLEGYRSAEASVTAIRGQVVGARLELAARLGTLRVTSDPPGATVAVDNRVVGDTPATLELPPGEVLLRFSHEGYVELQRRLAVREAQEGELHVRLRRRPELTATLRVESSSAGAHVFLDGASMGDVPVARADLEPGLRSLRVSLEGHEEVQEQLLLEPGAATRVRAHLTVPGDAPWPGLRWLGYGLSAATLASAVGVALAARSARESFWSAANPSAGDLDHLDRLNHTADALFAIGGAGLVFTLVADLVSTGPIHSRLDVVVDR